MGTHYQGHEAVRRALTTYIKLMRASESVTRRLGPNLRAAGLTISQLGVLEALLHLGPLTQGEVATKILKSSGNVTTVVDNLERRGLVARERHATDRRFVRVDLTPEGRALIADFFPSHAEAITAELAVLTDAEQAELGRLCQKLGTGPKDD